MPIQAKYFQWIMTLMGLTSLKVVETSVWQKPKRLPLNKYQVPIKIISRTQKENVMMVALNMNLKLFITALNMTLKSMVLQAQYYHLIKSQFTINLTKSFSTRGALFFYEFIKLIYTLMFL